MELEGSNPDVLDGYPLRLNIDFGSRIGSLLDALENWSNGDVLLMPEGVTPPSHERCAWIVRVCTQRGWRFCRRLHIDLFGNVRGT